MPVYLPFSGVKAPLSTKASPYTAGQPFAREWVPFAPVADAGWNDTLRPVIPITPSPYQEVISFALPANQQDVLVPFTVEKVSPALLLTGPMIVNTVDSDPLSGIGFVITNLSTGLLTLQLNCLLPTTNYIFQALVSVVR
jgi:hypothetical protein